MKYLFFILFLIPCLQIFPQGHDYNYPHDQPLITITVPDNWSVANDASLTVTNPEGDLTLEFCIMPADNIEQAVDAANMSFGFSISDIALEGKPSRWDKNGIYFTEQNETGRDENGELVYLTVIYIKLDPETHILALYSAAPSADEDYEDEVTGILESIIQHKT